MQLMTLLRYNITLIGGCIQPTWKMMLVKLGSSSPNRDESRKSLKPTPCIILHILIWLDTPHTNDTIKLHILFFVTPNGLFGISFFLVEHPSHQLQPNELGVAIKKISLYERQDSYIQTFNVWYISLHLPYKSSKCKQIEHLSSRWIYHLSNFCMINVGNIPYMKCCWIVKNTISTHWLKLSIHPHDFWGIFPSFFSDVSLGPKKGITPTFPF